MKKVLVLFIVSVSLMSCVTVQKTDSDSHFKFENNQFEFSNISSNDRERDFWYIYPASQEKKYQELNFQILKEKGQKNFGFGVVYNFIDENNYTRVLIDANQNLSVMTKVNGKEYMNLGWTFVPALYPGLNEINQIQIVQENDTKVNIFINGVLSVFISNGSPLFGSIGAYIAVGNEDKHAGDVKVKIMINNIKELKLDNII